MRGKQQLEAHPEQNNHAGFVVYNNSKIKGYWFSYWFLIDIWYQLVQFQVSESESGRKKWCLYIFSFQKTF